MSNCEDAQEWTESWRDRIMLNPLSMILSRDDSVCVFGRSLAALCKSLRRKQGETKRLSRVTHPFVSRHQLAFTRHAC